MTQWGRSCHRALRSLSRRKRHDYTTTDAAAVVGRVRSKPDEVETDYMTLKLCANGNLHIGFKRQDLVASINRIIAEHKGAVLGHDRRTRKHA